MLKDPKIMMMIIYILAGLCAVLSIAVIFLGIKRNSYYVDEEGNEVPPPEKMKRDRKPAPPAAVEEYEEDDEDEEEEAPPVKKTPQETVVVPVMRHPDPEPVPEEVTEEEDRGEDDPVMGPLFNAAVAATGAEVTVTINDKSENYVLDVMPCMIGRDARTCNLVLQEPAVSRRHARLFLQDNGLFIEDLAEHNGTFVNGTKLALLGQAQLNDGDIIHIGRAEIRIDRILY